MIYLGIDEFEEDRVYAAMETECIGANAMLLGFRVVLVNQVYPLSRALSATDPFSIHHAGDENALASVEIATGVAGYMDVYYGCVW